MLNFTSKTKYYLSSIPTDMRKGREGLADVDRYKSDLREDIAHERKLRLEAEAKLAMLEAKVKKNNN